MIRDYTELILTEEDKKNLYFISLSDKEQDDGIWKMKKKLRKHVLSEGLLAFLCMSVAFIFSENYMDKDAIWFAAMIGLVFMMLLIGLELIVYRSNIKLWKKKGIKKIEIVIQKKLPVEKEIVQRYDEPNDLQQFFPVEGKDIHTGYVSKIYISRKDYKNVPVGGIVQRIFSK